MGRDRGLPAALPGEGRAGLGLGVAGPRAGERRQVGDGAGSGPRCSPGAGLRGSGGGVGEAAPTRGRGAAAAAGGLRQPPLRLWGSAAPAGLGGVCGDRCLPSTSAGNLPEAKFTGGEEKNQTKTQQKPDVSVVFRRSASLPARCQRHEPVKGG